MLAYCHKPRILFLNNIKNQFNLFQISRTLAASSTSEGETHKYEPKYHDFTVKYLIKRLGLSPEIANSTSLRVKIQSLQKSDSVIALLRAHGFENAQISRIVTIVPKLLVINPDKITLSKLSFLSSVGITNEVIVSNPHLLVHSLDNKLIPCYNFFKSMALSEKQIVGISNRLPWAFASHLQHCIASNVKLLKEIGVTQKYISSLIYRRPRMVNMPIDRFKKLVEGVLELKFDPLKRTFVTALEIIYASTKLMWKHRIEVYKRWGWSEQDVLLAFQKFPGCMSTSEKKVMSTMDFLVNKMGFQSSAISRRPVVLSLSLELRIIPRCSVISVLQKKGMINEDLSLLSFTFLIHPDKKFLDKFITKYQEQVPELLSIYKGISLVQKDISNNILKGNLPIPPTNIMGYHVDNNHLTGKVPNEMCGLRSLKILHLFNNNMTGRIPWCLGNSLSVLNIGGNKFSGKIPQSYSEECNLKEMDLSQNKLEGQLPRSLSNCRMLHHLDLGDNQLEDTFPFWLGTLPQLQVLVLHANRFWGATASSPGIGSNFPMLHIIDVSQNSLGGYLPLEYIQKWSPMKYLPSDTELYEHTRTEFQSRKHHWTDTYTSSLTLRNKGKTTEYKKIFSIFNAIDFSSN